MVVEENKGSQASTEEPEVKSEVKKVENELYPEKEEKKTEVQAPEEEKTSEEKEAEAKEIEEKQKKESEQKETKEKQEKEKVKKEIPEKYDIKLPENSLISKEQLGEIESLAKDRGFSNEEAQGLLDSHNKIAEKTADIVQQASLDELKELTEVTWVKEAQEDKEIGGDDLLKNSEMSSRVLKKFGSEKLINILDPMRDDNPTGTGLGNHPELLRLFTRIGKIMSDDQLIFGSTKTESKKSPEQILYGGSEDSKESES